MVNTSITEFIETHNLPEDSRVLFQTFGDCHSFQEELTSHANAILILTKMTNGKKQQMKDERDCVTKKSMNHLNCNVPCTFYS